MTIPKTYFFTFAFCFIFSIYGAFAQITTSNTPQWVLSQDYDANPEIDLKEISYGLLTLLSDEQIHIPKQERYVRLVQKITDNVGVQDGSAISINYDPSYQQLFLHQISIIRAGKTIDKLNVNDFQTIRQESNAESYIYDGSLNAIANLADIRNGDILDVSYSIKGFNPIHGDHFSGGTTLNDFQPVGKINYYLISKDSLQYKTVNIDLAPTLGRYNGYTTYNWQTTLTETPDFETNVPMWYFSFQNLFVSNFKSWDEVVAWALQIYKDDVVLSNALQLKVKQIADGSPYEADRISATLKFVQDEIRYLGLESGIGAYRPFSPNEVLSQRFGDCKDKSWLMVTMLRHMGVKAYPVLINSAYGESLHQFLPSPRVFDHVVVKVIDSTAAHLFYDPTSSNQFGDYKSVAFPNYGKALVIKEGVTALESIKSKNENLVEVFDTYDAPTVGGPGTLNTMTVYRDAEADNMRALYKSNSITSISKEFKSYYDRLFDGVEVIKDPVFDDDSIANKLLVTESYKIESLWKPMIAEEENIAITLSPYSILDIFLSPTERTRETPFALFYPTRKKHQITIKLPQRWGVNTEQINVKSKSFDFSLKTKMNPSKDILYLNYDYKNHKSFVMPADFEEYYAKTKEVEQALAYYIYIPKSEAKGKHFESPLTTKNASSFASLFLWMIGLVILIGIGLVIYVVRSHRKLD